MFSLAINFTISRTCLPCIGEWYSTKKSHLPGILLDVGMDECVRHGAGGVESDDRVTSRNRGRGENLGLSQTQ